MPLTLLWRSSSSLLVGRSKLAVRTVDRATAPPGARRTWRRRTVQPGPRSASRGPWAACPRRRDEVVPSSVTVKSTCRRRSVVASRVAAVGLGEDDVDAGDGVRRGAQGARDAGGLVRLGQAQGADRVGRLVRQQQERAARRAATRISPASPPADACAHGRSVSRRQSVLLPRTRLGAARQSRGGERDLRHHRPRRRVVRVVTCA